MEYILPDRGDPGFDEAASPIIQSLLVRESLPASAYRTCENEAVLQIFLEDILDEYWPIFLTTMPDQEDLSAGVAGYLSKRFPGWEIPPVTVTRH
jgi:hypothetical protein